MRVDPDTYEITVDRVSSVHDSGTVLDQRLLEAAQRHLGSRG